MLGEVAVGAEVTTDKPSAQRSEREAANVDFARDQVADAPRAVGVADLPVQPHPNQTTVRREEMVPPRTNSRRWRREVTEQWRRCTDTPWVVEMTGRVSDKGKHTTLELIVTLYIYTHVH